MSIIVPFRLLSSMEFHAYSAQAIYLFLIFKLAHVLNVHPTQSIIKFKKYVKLLKNILILTMLRTMLLEERKVYHLQLLEWFLVLRISLIGQVPLVLTVLFQAIGMS